MISGIINIDIFAWSFRYFIGSHEDMAKLDGGVSVAHYKSWVVPDHRALYLVDNAGPDTIAHECLHLTNLCLKHIGHEIDTENDEVQAYLQAWIIRKINKKIDTYYKGLG